MQNAGLGEAQAGIKIAGRNINNFIYAGNTTSLPESGTKKPLNESERGEWKCWLKIHVQKMKFMTSGPITS